jgi:hypothetical protein
MNWHWVPGSLASTNHLFMLYDDSGPAAPRSQRRTAVAQVTGKTINHAMARTQGPGAYWHDADLAFAWLDDAWAVGANESRLVLFTHDLLHLHLQGTKCVPAGWTCNSSRSSSRSASVVDGEGVGQMLHGRAPMLLITAAGELMKAPHDAEELALLAHWAVLLLLCCIRCACERSQAGRPA